MASQVMPPWEHSIQGVWEAQKHASSQEPQFSSAQLKWSLLLFRQSTNQGPPAVLSSLEGQPHGRRQGSGTLDQLEKTVLEVSIRQGPRRKQVLNEGESLLLIFFYCAKYT